MESCHGSREDDDDEDAALQYMIAQSLEEQKSKDTSEEDMSEGFGSVFWAIRRGDEKLVRDLSFTDPGCLQQKDRRGWTPLHEAAAQNNQNLLQLIYTAGPDLVDQQNLQGQTPLFLAVEKGLMENASFLIQHGAQLDTQDQNQDPPLLTAIRSGRTDLVEMLLLQGSKVNQMCYHGRRPLHEASSLGSLELVALLLRAGAQPDPRSHYGLTPLALAAQGGHLEVAEMLLEKGADFLSQAQDEASILHEAAATECPALVRILLDYGADANVAKLTGHLPIHRAAHRGHLQVLELLIPVTSMSEVADSGISPLHSAAAGGNTTCIQALLSAGYNPNVMLHPSVRSGYHDGRKSALFFAVSNDDLESTRLLLEAGAMTNQDPVKCLQLALRLGNQALILLLLRHGANVNYYCSVNTTHFPSALQYALKDQVILRMLCTYGYDVRRCFDCRYGNDRHVPDDYEGWSNSVIKDTLFCEVITVSWLEHLSGQVVRTLLDYVDHVTICSKLRSAVMGQSQWPEICLIQENARDLQHLCRLRIRRCLGRLRLRSSTFMSLLPLPARLKEYVLYQE